MITNFSIAWGSPTKLHGTIIISTLLVVFHLWLAGSLRLGINKVHHYTLGGFVANLSSIFFKLPY